METELRRSGGSPELLIEYVSLFRECVPEASHIDIPYLDWLYNQNPDGSVIDAWDGTTLAAHYVCVPAPVEIQGGLPPPNAEGVFLSFLDFDAF